MSTAVARIGSAFRINRFWAWLVVLGVLVGIVAGVAAATYLGRLLIVLGLGVAGVVAVLSVRWPILGLAAFVVLIPIEGFVTIEGLGTASRFAGILFAATYGLPRLGRLTLAPIPAAGWAFLAWAILSLGWATDAYVTGIQLLTLVQLFVVAVFIADFVVQHPELVRPVLWVYSISAAATAVISIGAFLSSSARAAAQEGQDPAMFAATLLPAVMFGLHELVSHRQKLAGAAIALVTTLGVVVSGTRGAWVAGAVAILLFLFPRLSVRSRLTAAAAAAALVVLLFQLPGMAELLAERAGTALETGGAGRTDIWRVAQTIYFGDPVLGVGYANFPVAYTSEAVRTTGVDYYTLTNRAPHNLAIGTAVELGPIGLLLLALFFGPLLLRRFAGPAGVPVQAALAALMVLAFFLDIFGTSKTFWLVIGLGAGLGYLGTRRDDATGHATGDAGHAEAVDGPAAQRARASIPAS